ncbi:hypothetical protein PsorP6_007048 [Peronosclerospora sorghi]|uniref:Uncharacterized protein n=1 Tax=Peronosclerospora sorghi TaxID=230839 RepID=A0ACC0WAH5_9STRA|nr:hypothetical protein PsorP6_007048 [Peronosclerospora sorghi]
MGCDHLKDSKLPSLFPRKHYLDIVDDAWIIDKLSDDEIDVPPELEFDPTGTESPFGIDSFLFTQVSRRWGRQHLKKWIGGVTSDWISGPKTLLKMELRF